MEQVSGKFGATERREGIKTRTPTPWGIRRKERREGDPLLMTMMAKKREERGEYRLSILRRK